MNYTTRFTCRPLWLVWVLAAVSVLPIQAKSDDAIAIAAKAMKLRSIGPAKFGGRIADIAVDPQNKATWYVAVGSGGLWKTTNAGTTFQPVFDEQASYSIGTVVIDPRNSNTIWVGTGENVSGRHVGWGDGVYKSDDGGKTWKNMGIKDSQHISRILIDPRDSDVVIVAAEGPLWSAGGDRGVYKSNDGGQTWTLVLKIDGNTGVTDIEFAPDNPDMLYAAAYQRRRSTWGFLGGGPKSGIYKSVDNGDSWIRKSLGLPQGDMGKIGLAVTQADPNRVFATIEANNKEKGFYRSDDSGESWSHLNSLTSGGTGPHYYQELEASQSDADLIYQMDVFLRRSNDGGKTFEMVGTAHEKHSDNHAMWIDPDNGNHYLVGSDAGLYETFDRGVSYRHFGNMPISQFYKVAVDNAVPFYNILGGAQDLGTIYGPSRTLNTEGIRASDWYVPLGADGYGVGFHPKDDDMMYMMWQVGNLMRHDKKLGESVFIKPQPEQGDPPERWNWDSPLLNSPHNADRIYFGSQRVWVSDQTGDSWTPISPDLTRNENRYSLKMTDRRVWSVDALYDHRAMSQYNTITAMSESPLSAGVIYAGTDDGLISSTNDGGASWQTSTKIAELPTRAFINDLEASRFDADTVFAVASNHKVGDFSPYVVESTNRGESWTSIAGDLPDGVIVWAIEQDHVNQDLLFVGAENGLYFSPNRGQNWHRLSGAPTIPFRDVQIQRRDNDIVGATFGRGFYILDDYTALREMSSGGIEEKATLFSIRDAWWFVPLNVGQAVGEPTQGSTRFDSPNPPHGAVITYHLKKDFQDTKTKRREQEKKLRNDHQDIPFPGYDQLQAERLDSSPQVMVRVSDMQGQPLRWLKASASAGTHRVNWDLRLPSPDSVQLEKPAFAPPWARPARGAMVPPGEYQAELILVDGGKVSSLTSAKSFNVKSTPTSRQGLDYAATTAFQTKAINLIRILNAASDKLGLANTKLKRMQAAMLETPGADQAMFAKLNQLNQRLNDLNETLSGDRDRKSLNEDTTPSLFDYAYYASSSVDSRALPTATMQNNFSTAEAGLPAFLAKVKEFENEIKLLDQQLAAAGAPSSK